MNKRLQPLLKGIDPLHGVKGLEARVLHGVSDVGQRVECQELGRLRELGAPAIKVSFEVDLFSLELLLSASPEVLIIIRMKDVHNEVQVEVELELFRDEVASEHFLRD